MAKQSFKTVEHENVFGKKTRYVKLEQENREPIYIQIGESNFNKIKELSNETPTTLDNTGGKRR